MTLYTGYKYIDMGLSAGYGIPEGAQIILVGAGANTLVSCQMLKGMLQLYRDLKVLFIDMGDKAEDLIMGDNILRASRLHKLMYVGGVNDRVRLQNILKTAMYYDIIVFNEWEKCEGKKHWKMCPDFWKYWTAYATGVNKTCIFNISNKKNVTSAEMQLSDIIANTEKLETGELAINYKGLMAKNRWFYVENSLYIQEGNF